MKNRYLCTFMDCISLLHPKGYKVDSFKEISLSEDLINLINQYCNEKSLKLACHNRITYYIALVVKRSTRLFSSNKGA